MAETYKDNLDSKPSLIEEFRQMALTLHNNHTNVGATKRMEEWKNCKMTFCRRRYEMAFERGFVAEINGPPLPMIIFCPECHTQHIDEPEPQCDYICTLDDDTQCVKIKGHDNGSDNDVIVHSAQEKNSRWTNPPHKSHLCSNCGLVFRFADITTTGVAEINTRGERDTWKVNR